MKQYLYVIALLLIGIFTNQVWSPGKTFNYTILISSTVLLILNAICDFIDTIISRKEKK